MTADRREITLVLKDSFAAALRDSIPTPERAELMQLIGAYDATLINTRHHFAALAQAATHKGMAELYNHLSTETPAHYFAVGVDAANYQSLRKALGEGDFARHVLVMT